METAQRFDAIEKRIGFLQADVSEIKTSVKDMQGAVTQLTGIVTDLSGTVTDLSGTVRDLSGTVTDLSGTVTDLADAMHAFSDRTDQQFAEVYRRFSQTATKDDIDDVLGRAHERATGTAKKVDLHVDAVVDTLADHAIVTPKERRRLHAMEPFPKLVKDA